MHRTANISLVLTKSSSLEQFADPQTAISYGGFYQQLTSQLLRGVHREKVISELSDSLVKLAEHAHAFRQMAIVDDISQVLLRIPSRQCEAVGRYYQALCVHRFGRGDVERAARLIEPVAESAPPKYRARALILLGANSFRKGDNQSALSLYREAGRFVSVSNLYDPFAIIHAQRMFGVISSKEGNHGGAVSLLENLLPLARTMHFSQPHVYYDYMNSLAVELGEVGRLEEAKNVSRIVLASPFASAYPEWRETSNEIDIKGWRASRSVVGFTRTPEASNIVRLPVSDSLDLRSFIEPVEPGSRATVLSMQQWKKKMTKKENDTPESEKDLSQMDGRELLLEIMSITGSKERTDDELLQMLRAINKVLAEPKGKGEK
jgi:tetratricopeptide (TPR) repeat protein